MRLGGLTEATSCDAGDYRYVNCQLTRIMRQG